ncbi:hypothetical protein QYE76_027945 [Lolium multiflorum]|uniref:Uncharacterized protein n=1 Tax=Lolium multiflorum TaxID=4521 RepID=A0AAD8QMR8_LOLMU|nr:hypothetical protein QYE76_027945 [Lolium multiflorum]
MAGYGTARRTTTSAGVPYTSRRRDFCTWRATRRRLTSARPEDSARARGVPIPPPPVGGDALNAVLVTLNDEQCAEERYFPDDYAVWNKVFRRKYEQELVAYDGPPPPPAQQRSRPLPMVERAGPHPRECAHAHRGRQLPRPGDAAAGGGAFCVAPTRKLLDATAHGVVFLVIREGARASSSPARRRKRKAKKEGAAAAAEASDLAAEETARAEDAAVAEAIARQEREEAEQQRWLLDLAAAAAQPARGALLIKLEDSSEDEWYKPTSSPPRLGDPGQGSSRWALG